MPGLSISRKTGASAILDVPLCPQGAKSNPSMGHSKPELRPVTGAMGNSDTRQDLGNSSLISGGQSTITSFSACRMQRLCGLRTRVFNAAKL